MLGPNKTQGLSVSKMAKSSFASMPKTSSYVDSIESNLRPSQDYGENTTMTYLRLQPATSPDGLASSPASFVVFASSFAAENVSIERLEDHSDFFCSFIHFNLSRFETEELQLPAPLSQEHNQFAPSPLAAWLTFMGLLARLIILHRASFLL